MSQHPHFKIDKKGLLYKPSGENLSTSSTSLSLLVSLMGEEQLFSCYLKVQAFGQPLRTWRKLDLFSFSFVKVQALEAGDPLRTQLFSGF